MAHSSKVYSIGYGNRPLDNFVSLLKRYEIQALSDVRSVPYSARFPDFVREQLAVSLKREGISYVFMGDLLGARPSDPNLYQGGRASYGAMASSPGFRHGIERLVAGAQKYSLAIMCAEKDPIDCHRAILISRVLEQDGVEVLHIDAKGSIESQTDLEHRLLERYKLVQPGLFGSGEGEGEDPISVAYERRGRELAYDATAAPAARGSS